MNRDPSVTITVLGLIACIVVQNVFDIPEQLNTNDPVGYQVFFWVFLLLVIRMVVLVFQTFIHSIKEREKDSRVGWAIGHFFLGPLASVMYFYSYRKPTQPKASDNEDKPRV